MDLTTNIYNKGIDIFVHCAHTHTKFETGKIVNMDGITSDNKPLSKLCREEIIGMSFDSLNHAQGFYKAYAFEKGFSVCRASTRLNVLVFLQVNNLYVQKKGLGLRKYKNAIVKDVLGRCLELDVRLVCV